MRHPWSSALQKIRDDRRAIRRGKAETDLIKSLMAWAKEQCKELQTAARVQAPISEIYNSRIEWIDYALIPKLKSMLPLNKKGGKS
jgi:hypothetical protein